MHLRAERVCRVHICLSIRCILGDIRLRAGDPSTTSCFVNPPREKQGRGPSSAPSGPETLRVQGLCKSLNSRWGGTLRPPAPLRRVDSIKEQLLRRRVNRVRGGLVFKAHTPVFHSTLCWRVTKNVAVSKKCPSQGCGPASQAGHRAVPPRCAAASLTPHPLTLTLSTLTHSPLRGLA